MESDPRARVKEVEEVYHRSDGRVEKFRKELQRMKVSAPGIIAWEYRFFYPDIGMPGGMMRTTSSQLFTTL